MALAERYGSETAVTLQGTYYLPGTLATKTLSNGNVSDTATHTVVQVTNRTILEAMHTRNLIATINGYRLVMVAHAHMADGTAWFATPATGTPVAVPSDLFALGVAEGPANGQTVVDGSGVLKSLSQQTHNQAGLVFGSFTGTGVLTQNWTSRAVKNGAATEVVELVASTGNFSGSVTANPNPGVGLLTFTLSGAKTIDLTRYGMANSTESTVTGGSLSGSLSLTSTSVTTNVGSLNFSGGTLQLNSGNSTLGTSNNNVSSLNLNVSSTLNLSNVNFANIGTVTINTTAGGSATGLIVDANGNVTQLPTFGSSLPATLIIITSSGSHTYTHDSNGVWTLVTS
ncbi:MAG: hypothetical protein JF599_08625 [Verrucomicrobia bacterium]|nr:hypothetical protein [Verrucomicrobiota bacterium]